MSGQEYDTGSSTEPGVDEKIWGPRDASPDYVTAQPLAIDVPRESRVKRGTQKVGNALGVIGKSTAVTQVDKVFENAFVKFLMVVGAICFIIVNLFIYLLAGGSTLWAIVAHLWYVPFVYVIGVLTLFVVSVVIYDKYKSEFGHLVGGVAFVAMISVVVVGYRTLELISFESVLWGLAFAMVFVGPYSLRAMKAQSKQSLALAKLRYVQPLIKEAEEFLAAAEKRDAKSERREATSIDLLSKATSAEAQARAIVEGLPGKIVQAAKPLVEAATAVNNQRLEEATAAAQAARIETEAQRMHLRAEIETDVAQANSELIAGLRQTIEEQDALIQQLQVTKAQPSSPPLRPTAAGLPDLPSPHGGSNDVSHVYVAGEVVH